MQEVYYFAPSDSFRNITTKLTGRRQSLEFNDYLDSFGAVRLLGDDLNKRDHLYALKPIRHLAIVLL